MGVFWLTAAAASVMGLSCFIVLEGVLVRHAKKKPRAGADYVVVLGAKVNGGVVSPTLKRRLDAAAAYAVKNGKASVVVSGGRGWNEDVSEAWAMKEYLIGKGIAEDRIHMEDESKNTKENLTYSKELIVRKDGEEAVRRRLVVVSSGFHLYRATSIAKKQGFHQVEGLGAPTAPGLRAYYYVREALAVIKDSWKGNM